MGIFAYQLLYNMPVIKIVVFIGFSITHYLLAFFLQEEETQLSWTSLKHMLFSKGSSKVDIQVQLLQSKGTQTLSSVQSLWIEAFVLLLLIPVLARVNNLSEPFLSFFKCTTNLAPQFILKLRNFTWADGYSRCFSFDQLGPRSLTYSQSIHLIFVSFWWKWILTPSTVL